MTLALLAEYGPSLLQGFGTTILLSAAILAIATPVALALALARDSRIPLLAWPVAVLVNSFRLVPALLVLFFTFYAMPQLGFRFSPFGAALTGLTVVGAAYLSEDIRGGLAAIDRGQYRAARALGLPWAHTLRRIILPQAVPLIIPPYVTRAIIIVKGTSLASIVAVGELTAQAVRASSITYEPFMFLTIASVLYLVLSGTLALLQSWAEARVSQARRARVAAQGLA